MTLSCLGSELSCSDHPSSRVIRNSKNNKQTDQNDDGDGAELTCSLCLLSPASPQVSVQMTPASCLLPRATSCIPRVAQDPGSVFPQLTALFFRALCCSLQ